MSVRVLGAPLLCSFLAFSCSAGGGTDADAGSDSVADSTSDGSPSSGGTGGTNVGSGGQAAASGGAVGTGGGANATGGAANGTGGAAGDCTPKPDGVSVDQMDGTFLDERTCLMWMKDEWANTGDFIGKDHAADCVNASIAGYTDWRGPDAAEMISLISDSASCGMWNSPNLWDSMVNTEGMNEPVMFYTATEGDGLGSDHQCAINGNTAELNGGTRKNPWHVLCVRGTSPVTGTVTSCTGTACDY